MLLNFQRYVFLTLKTTFLLKKTKKITKAISEKYCRYSILKVRYSILFETVKTPRNSAYRILDDRDSQPLIPNLEYINGTCVYCLFLLDQKKKINLFFSAAFVPGTFASVFFFPGHLPWHTNKNKEGTCAVHFLSTLAYIAHMNTV